jgi:hypothetical protein
MVALTSGCFVPAGLSIVGACLAGSVHSFRDSVCDTVFAMHILSEAMLAMVWAIPGNCLTHVFGGRSKASISCPPRCWTGVQIASEKRRNPWTSRGRNSQVPSDLIPWSET